MPSREDILANITTGPGRPSRGDILAGMTTGAPGPLFDLVKRPKDQPERTPGLTTEQMFPRPETVHLPQLPESRVTLHSRVRDKRSMETLRLVTNGLASG